MIQYIYTSTPPLGRTACKGTSVPVQRCTVTFTHKKDVRPIQTTRTVIQLCVASLGDSSTSTTEVLINPYPDHEVNKLMFLSEWRVFPSAPCFAGK